jgi:hypothetical protein
VRADGCWSVQRIEVVCSSSCELELSPVRGEDVVVVNNLGNVNRARARVLSKPDQIVASDVRFVQPLDNLGASESAALIENCNARDESKLLPELSAFT